MLEAEGGRLMSPRRLYAARPGLVHGVISLLLAVLVWEVAARQLGSLILAPLGTIWSALREMIASGELWIDLSYSGRAFAISFVLAAVGGIVIGLAMAASTIVHDVVDPWVSALYATPIIALAPLFIVVFGIELPSKIAVALLLAIFPVIINTASGIRTADRALIEGAYSFGANRVQIFSKVLIPSAVPFIITGLRLAVGRALIGVVVAEFFGSRAGLGHMVFTASQSFDTGAVFAGVFILMAVATVLMKLMYRLERRIAPWRNFEMP
jgi:ABC-type nitrate/sulfonate/bicarbonate transport system permease component